MKDIKHIFAIIWHVGLISIVFLVVTSFNSMQHDLQREKDTVELMQSELARKLMEVQNQIELVDLPIAGYKPYSLGDKRCFCK